MKFSRIFLSLVILLSNSYSNHLENFYNLLDQYSFIKLNVSITQNQFEKNYKSIGDFFILGSNKYFYDSSELKISVNKHSIITKNYLNRQIVYNDLSKGELNLFDILSGNRNTIEFMDYNDNQNRYDFHIPNMGFKGYFLFESSSGKLKLIHFDNDLDYHISININKIEILDAYKPNIDKEDFEVIDLRG